MISAYSNRIYQNTVRRFHAYITSDMCTKEMSETPGFLTGTPKFFSVPFSSDRINRETRILWGKRRGLGVKRDPIEGMIKYNSVIHIRLGNISYPLSQENYLVTT